MSQDIKLDSSKFDIPEDAKAGKVFDRLMHINTVITEEGLHEAYYERHDKVFRAVRYYVLMISKAEVFAS